MKAKGRRSTNIRDATTPKGAAKQELRAKMHKDYNPMMTLAEERNNEYQIRKAQDLRQAVQEDDPQKAVKKTHGR